MPSRVALYYHTLKHLRPVQLRGRLRFRLARPKPDLAPAPGLAVPTGAWVTPAARTASMTGPEAFVFLGQAGSLDADGWDNPARDKLWRYNLHYCDDLNAEGAAARRDWHAGLIARWIAENPPGPVSGAGSGWEPYPTSLRIVNWIKAALGGMALPDAAHHSLAVQARWLTQRLEWHLLGNHLFANAKALMFAGLYFDGPEARGWRAVARRILETEIDEQILPDGGHFELSPMYHALAFEDMLDLANLMRARGTPEEDALRATVETRLAAMARWLVAMSHPDGGIGFFNDAALGIAPETDALLSYAGRLGGARPAREPGSLSLPQSGYHRLVSGRAVLLADTAAVGPDYLPGHAHADTLSFELSLAGQRVIVNGGTSEYGTGPARQQQRGTAAHATVTVAGQDSSEVWAGFRVARRARVHDVARDGTRLAARHDGYQRLTPGTDHHRLWQLDPDGLTVTDRIDPAQCGVARYPLHPGIAAEITATGSATLTLPDGTRLTARAEAGGPLTRTSAPWHPRFGESRPAPCLVLPLIAGRAVLRLDWA
ncbi:heparinase II/III family protein [Cognatishimia sp. F0-27]|uniref:heparinase II/III family protein n=1 Tax=Cognatishimia sp. F0-27 TaxID=2816855 RepID=UPI001D0C09C4|nr:alginate lyase family protein [Cognatishimia sp. F0-27]MCC1494838.1 alginate lyase family protein [Cognatishimia sp. F0-27]